MHDLKLSEAGYIDNRQISDVVLKDPACRECLHAYRENLRVSLGSVLLPAFVSLSILTFTKAEHLAYTQEFGSDYPVEIAAASRERKRQAFAQVDIIMQSLYEEERPQRTQLLKDLNERLEHIMRCFGPVAFRMLEGTLKSTFIQTWTALEVLFEDLLTKVVGAHPNCFLSVDSSKFYLRRLNNKGTRYWYDKAFRGDKTICGIINDEAISALAEIRHVLVHKSGKQDGSFREAVGEIARLSRYQNDKEGDTILFDGEMTRFFVESATTKAYDLVLEIDRWLEAQQTTNPSP